MITKKALKISYLPDIASTFFEYAFTQLSGYNFTKFQFFFMLFQWCVGGHCVGNVPIYAHQSFSKPNTEKWTKGQELLHTPLFS